MNIENRVSVLVFQVFRIFYVAGMHLIKSLSFSFVLGDCLSEAYESIFQERWLKRSEMIR